MVKFSKEEKLEAVKRYLAGEDSLGGIADSIGVDEGDLRTWLKGFEYRGEEAFEKSYTVYSASDKLDVLNYMQEKRTSQRETAAIFNIKSPASIRKWEALYKNGGVDALQPKKKGRPSMRKKEITETTPSEESLGALQAEVDYLRAETAYLKKTKTSSQARETSEYKKKAKVVHDLRKEFGLKPLLKISGLARSTYYYWVNAFGRMDKYGKMKTVIQDIFHTHKGRYGYRRITMELRRQGYSLNHKTVRRLMKTLGLKSLVRMKKYRSYKGKVGKIAPNILQRDFYATKPNQKWVTDVSECHLFGEKLYVSPVLDLFNGEIISYTIASRPVYSLVGKMLDKAVKRLREGDKVILHSDQGWHYQMKKYSYVLRRHGIIQSMSRKGNCLDNAVIENFFGLLKSELLYLQEFENMNHFKRELQAYIHYYNHSRIRAKLKGMTPVEYRNHASPIA